MVKIYVLPISGGGFVSQLALLAELYDATFEDDFAHTMRDSSLGIVHKRSLPGTPDLVLASSGGNVAAYLAMVSGWSSGGITNNISAVKASIFVQPWTPPFLPSWVMFPFTQSLYRNGSGMDQLFMAMYTPASIKQTEIWTGTYNTTTQRCGLFCNLSKEDAFVQDGAAPYGNILYDADPYKYLNGDVVKISKAVHASAAIPFITEGIYIDDSKYIDGGLAYSSPIIPISDQLKVALDKYFQTPSPCRKLLQLFYFCSYDMDQQFTDSMWTKSVGLMIHSSALQDRAFSLSFSRQYINFQKDPQIYKHLDSKKLRQVLGEIKNKSYIVFLYPLDARSLNVADFSQQQLKEYVAWTRKHYAAIIWVSQ